jgi:hypothetical protein
MPGKGKRAKPEDELKNMVCARVTDEEYDKLVGLLPYTARFKMSLLLRRILENRPIRIFTRDRSMDPLVAELEISRQRMRSAGQKVNHYIRRFNSAKNEAERRFFAKLAISMAASIGPDIEQLLEIVQILAKEFLDQNGKSKGLQPGRRRIPNIYTLATELAAAAEQQKIGSELPPGFGASQSG